MNADQFRLTLAPGTYTALFIWQRILEIVKEEPLRLDMRSWTSLFKGWSSFITNKPACGTIHCLAGWYTHITGLLDTDGHLKKGDDWHPVEVLRSMGVSTTYNGHGANALLDSIKSPGVRALMELFFEVGWNHELATTRLEEILITHRDEFEAIRVGVS